MENTIKWVKFMFSNGKQSVYFNTDASDSDMITGQFQHDAGEHGFTDAEDAQSKSTAEVFIFWDGQPVGAGKLAA